MSCSLVGAGMAVPNICHKSRIFTTTTSGYNVSNIISLTCREWKCARNPNNIIYESSSKLITRIILFAFQFSLKDAKLGLCE